MGALFVFSDLGRRKQTPLRCSMSISHLHKTSHASNEPVQRKTRKQYKKYGQAYPHLPKIEEMITKFDIKKSDNTWETMIEDVAITTLFE